jgi:hypothetical protein
VALPEELRVEEPEERETLPPERDEPDPEVLPTLDPERLEAAARDAEAALVAEVARVAEVDRLPAVERAEEVRTVLPRAVEEFRDTEPERLTLLERTDPLRDCEEPSRMAKLRPPTWPARLGWM